MKRNPLHRIAVRLVLWHSGMTLLLLGFLAALLYTQLDRSLRAELDDHLREAAQSAMALVELEHRELVFEETEPGRITPDLLPGVENRRDLVRLIDGGGRVVSAPDALRALPVDGTLWATATAAHGLMETALLEAERVRIHTVPVLKDGRRLGTLQIVTSLEPLQRTLRYLLEMLCGIGAVALVLVLLLGQFLARRALDPVQAITGAARAMSATSLSQRLNLPDTGDELSHLAASFDEMLDRIEEAYQRQREFAANASHELRAPLALIKGEASLAARAGTQPEAMRAALGAIEDNADRMAALVSDLLLLARLDRGGLLRATPVGLDEVAHDVAGRLSGLARERGVQLRVEAPESVVVRGDQASLARVIRNLVENALEYAPAGVVRIAITAAADGLAVTRVSDTGCGIPTSHQDRVFDRFYRADSARSNGGFGLGLALCREIVAAHGGTIQLESEEGRGTTVTFALPLLPGSGVLGGACHTGRAAEPPRLPSA
jgi:heavy metal sensor kinase